MIEWGPHEKVMVRGPGNVPTNFYHYFQKSVAPTGYIINMIPYLQFCHLQCLHISDAGRVTHIGTVHDLDKRDTSAKRNAASKLRAACEVHATAATPSSSAADG